MARITDHIQRMEEIESELDNEKNLMQDHLIDDFDLSVAFISLEQAFGIVRERLRVLTK